MNTQQNTRSLWIGFIAILIAVGATAEAKSKTPAAPPKSTYDATHADLDATLHKIVGDAPGAVNYRKLRGDQKALLAYLKNTSHVTQKTYDGLSDNEKKAFLINAYNAFTLKLVVDNYPTTSIKKSTGMFAKPWKLKFFTLLGKQRSLDDVENEMLRKQFADPRVLFAINSGTIGSAPLRNEAYVGDKLEDQLNDQTKRLLTDSNLTQMDAAAKTLKLSKIFDLYPDDFTKNGGSVQKFVEPFLVDDKPENAAVKKDFDDGAFTLSYFDFDWNLNDKKE